MDKMLRNFGVLFFVVASFHLSFGALLDNGDFETPPNPSAMSGTKVNGQNSIPGWQTSGVVEYIVTGEKQGDMILVVPQGKSAVRLGEGGSISQRARLQKGHFYAVTFSFARTCGQEEKLNVTVSPAVGPTSASSSSSSVLPLQTMYSNVGFDSYACGFQAKEDEVYITLHNPVNKEDDPSCGPLVDTVALNELRSPRFAKANLVKNGDFEEGPQIFHKSTWGVIIPPNIKDKDSPLPGWIIESIKAVKYIDSPHFSIPSAKKAVELVAGRESVLAQVIRTIPGKTYVLSFYVGDARNACLGDLEVVAFAGKDSVRVPYTSKGTGGFKRAQLVFKPMEDRTRIRFLSNVYSTTTQGSLCGPVVDDVRVWFK